MLNFSRSLPLMRARLAHWIPGLPDIRHYSRADLRPDLIAGVSVATVALPVCIAYAQLAGFSPVVGLYSAILPMIAYAFFGSSRQLIVGPDAATCAVIAAALGPLAQGDPERYHALAISLTLFTGLFCLLAGRLRLGFLADLLSRPILTGLLNGVAVSIIVGQLGKVWGVSVASKDVVGQIISLVPQLAHPHLPTLWLSLALFLLYIVLKRLRPNGPVALVVAAVAIAASFLFDLDARHVVTVGDIPSSVPRLHWPALPHEDWGSILPSAALLAFVSFSSGMLTARSFAAKNGYQIDGNQEFVALGIVDIVSALSQGFAVTGADSRTAVNDASGSRTRMAQIFAAFAILLALLLLSVPLAALPTAALALILIFSSLGLMDFKAYLTLYRVSRAECAIAAGTFAAVLILGIMPGILFAIMIALLRFLGQVARPTSYPMALADDGDFHSNLYYPKARPVPGLLVFRFEAPLIFFNASYFRQCVEQLVQNASEPVRWVLIDAHPISMVDLTGAITIMELNDALEEQGINLAFCGRQHMMEQWLQTHKFKLKGDLRHKLFSNRRAALQAWREVFPDSPPDAVSVQP
ncbi:SulP family inorganic anion transporter [Silvimonas soli]|uniref:SulP family inorganic anion transporter n=1 Tax=Silvimonas soli TaxID=2980100 RepID=UPI0024B35938|nr:sulfate permease [Silvimonas soli]